MRWWYLLALFFLSDHDPGHSLDEGPELLVPDGIDERVEQRVEGAHVDQQMFNAVILNRLFQDFSWWQAKFPQKMFLPFDQVFLT